MEKLKKELRTFVYFFDDLLTTFFFFFFFFVPDHYRTCFDFFVKNEQFQENFNKIKQCFVEDFIKQLGKIVKKSETYKTEKILLKKFLLINKKDTRKNFLCQNIF